MLDGMWTFLIVGAFGAIGAAAAAGTVMALLAHRRTGAWPGQDHGELTRGRLLSLWARVVVGFGVAAWAFATLSSRGLMQL